MSKIPKTKKSLILAYSVLYVFSLAIFWFIEPIDAFSYALLVFYILLPMAIFLIALSIGIHNHWGKKKWLAVPVFAFTYMSADYLTFRLANTIAFGNINAPRIELFVTAAILSSAGLLIGIAANHRKNRTI